MSRSWIFAISIALIAIKSLLAGQQSILAQTPTDLTGKVVDLEGQPIEGATVRMKLTDKETATLENGLFTLSAWTGNYAGDVGRYYAKILQDDWTGEGPTAAYWRSISLVEDTRLAAFATDVSEYTFAAPARGPVTVEAKLVYRRAFQQLIEQKGWDDPDLVMEEDAVKVLPKDREFMTKRGTGIIW